MNLSGGKWIIRLRKGVADRLWEDLVLSIIGDQFAGCNPDSPVPGVDGEAGERGKDSAEYPEICGCTISVRQNEDIITVWNRTDSDPKIKDKIKWVFLISLAYPPADSHGILEVKLSAKCSVSLKSRTWSINPTTVRS